jgi:hypothetical protein
MDTFFRTHSDGLALLAGLHPDDRQRSAEAARSAELTVIASALRADRKRGRARITARRRPRLLADPGIHGGRLVRGAPTR